MKFKNYYFKIILVLLWLGVFMATFYWYRHSGLTLKQVPHFIRQTIIGYGSVKAAVFFIVFYMLSSLLFFPPSQILNLAAGLIFGPYYGIIYSFIGLNLNANFAFLIARFLGRDFIKSHENHTVLKKFDDNLKDNGFLTTLILRLTYIPIDLVNFACGLSAMRQLDFALATAIGIIPNILTFNLVGGSLRNPLHLIISGAIFILGIALALSLKKIKGQKYN